MEAVMRLIVFLLDRYTTSRNSKKNIQKQPLLLKKLKVNIHFHLGTQNCFTYLKLFLKKSSAIERLKQVENTLQIYQVENHPLFIKRLKLVENTLKFEYMKNKVKFLNSEFVYPETDILLPVQAMCFAEEFPLYSIHIPHIFAVRF